MHYRQRAALIGLCIGGISFSLSARQVAQGVPEFKLVSVNVPNAGIWQLNRAIELRFNKAVYFGSVSPSSIAIAEIGGPPAVGEYFLKPGDPATVVFQPHCPSQPDLSDAGLKFGGVRYVIEVAGTNGGALMPISTPQGELLASGARRVFTTPSVALPTVAFYDTKAGGPRPIVRNVHGDAIDATYVELAGDTTQRVYFERDPATGAVSLPIELPLNLLSDPATHVALVVEIDQAIDPSPSNVDLSRVHWQYRDQAGAWREMEATIELVRNCGGRGATVRLEPIAVLPPMTDMRAVIEPTFSDIVGQTNLLAQSNFAPARTEAAPSPLADEHLEEFDSNALEDTTSVFAEPRAVWGLNHGLASQVGFSGTGGPGGDFDVVVAAGQTLVLDTTFASLQGFAIIKGPTGDFIGFIGPISSSIAINGRVDVNDLWIQAGGVLRLQGPNPAVVAVSGRAQIDGRIDVSGTSSNGVVTLNTTNVPEPGAAGQAGGGRGGTGSPLTTQSSPQGGAGFGAFNAPNLGGQGGEAGWSLLADVNKRRGAGGGGGVFGANVAAPMGASGAFDQRRIGLDAEKGFDNWLGDNGALHPGQPPVGGSVGASPFIDGDPSNDFFGKAIDANTQQLIVGELAMPWAGSGGGGGGDASKLISGTFPGPWNPTGDEKGAGGGGGGGSVRIVALGPIVFGSQGQVRARGGFGGGGENTVFLNRVGGGSGGGSGGHVVLESALRIDLSALAPNALAVDARGGQGGAGASDVGGAHQTSMGQQETLPLQDACPPGYPTTGLNGCRGQVDGAGGDGGPGVIQLHTPNGVVGTNGAFADILVPSGVGLADACSPPPLFAGGATGGAHLLPSPSVKSRAQSKWIALGHGGFDAGGSAGAFNPLMLDFAGIDPSTGQVLATNGVVDELPAIVGPLAVQPAPAFPNIPDPCGYVVVFDAAPIAASPYAFLLANDELLTRSVLVLSELADPSNRARFDVVDAVHDAAAGTLSVLVANPGPGLCSFPVLGGIAVTLEPALFRVTTNGNFDSLPSSSAVRIRFQATTADASGAPNAALATPFTSDPASINAAAANGEIRFLRFDVQFDRGRNGLVVPPDTIALDFLRLPFSY